MVGRYRAKLGSRGLGGAVGVGRASECVGACPCVLKVTAFRVAVTYSRDRAGTYKGNLVGPRVA